MWFALMIFRYPALFRYATISVMNARPVTHQLEKTYQPNIVLNQCVSMLMIQSHAATEELTAKNTRNQADSERLRNQYDVEGSRSSASMFLRIWMKNQYQRPKNKTMRKM